MAKTQYSINLIKQMAECDANYIRLLKLVPGLDAYRNALPPRTCLNDSIEVSQQQSNQEQLIGSHIEFCIADFGKKNEVVKVVIKVIEAFKYTSTVEITQYPELKKWMTNPSMLVRVYHDVSSAEVISYQGHTHLKPRYPQPNPNMYYPDEKYQVNKFLGEWLSYCLQAGRSKMPALVLDTSSGSGERYAG